MKYITLKTTMITIIFVLLLQVTQQNEKINRKITEWYSKIINFNNKHLCTVELKLQNGTET